ncbi:unnamed protein product [Ectocarpus sp. 8 AP-2014]
MILKMRRSSHPSSPSLSGPLCCACGLFAFALVASVNLKRITTKSPEPAEMVADTTATAAIAGTAAVVDSADTAVHNSATSMYAYELLSGLIDPHNGDNGTDPAQTVTAECAGQFDLPVLGGVDVVEYWRLPSAAEAVLGSPNLMSVFGNYRFFFSSVENLRVFEARGFSLRSAGLGSHDKLKYVPAWGGFCSYGIANEPVWTSTTLGPFGNPSKWGIYDGRLHIFRSSTPKEEFEEDIPGNLDRGNAVWEGWFGGMEESLVVPPINTACFCNDHICDDQ